MSGGHDAHASAPLPPGPELDRSRSVALRYLIASTAILGASGILGVVLRDSQAGVGRIDQGWWYALMTAHGLGTFVGWAGFALMGLSFWVLAQVGFPLRRFGKAMAEATWWLMVVGVAGVVVTTLGFKFGGSWVFLYPMSFHSAGQWGRWTSFFFSFSVLLVGLSIVTWCLAILHTVLGPALHAVKTSLPNRLGVALGFGYVSPARFATNPRPVPYAVIPLTVIAIDMIIATLPLAVLLVEMMVQSLSPSVTVDPLLAKNVLWFFGHPVVYLLLFPTVAVYYLLIPRFAGRVARRRQRDHDRLGDRSHGERDRLGAPHLHRLPVGLASGGAEHRDGAAHLLGDDRLGALALQSLLHDLPLALRLERGVDRPLPRPRQLAARRALGVINATIAFDQVIHNTLWIVGHFHQMAFLAIGLGIIGATYAWLPELVGKPLYSEAMARWHVWLTFVFATANSAVWLYQGLLGGPRRFAVLPHRYDAATQLSVPITACSPPRSFSSLGTSSRRSAARSAERAPVRGRRRR